MTERFFWVLRGGAWPGGPYFLRAVGRYRDWRDYQNRGIGFRLVVRIKDE